MKLQPRYIPMYQMDDCDDWITYEEMHRRYDLGIWPKGHPNAPRARRLKYIQENVPRLLIVIVVVSALYGAFRGYPRERITERIVVTEKTNQGRHP